MSKFIDLLVLTFILRSSRTQVRALESTDAAFEVLDLIDSCDVLPFPRLAVELAKAIAMDVSNSPAVAVTGSDMGKKGIFKESNINPISSNMTPIHLA